MPCTVPVRYTRPSRAGCILTYSDRRRRVFHPVSAGRTSRTGDAYRARPDDDNADIIIVIPSRANGNIVFNALSRRYRAKADGIINQVGSVWARVILYILYSKRDIRPLRRLVFGVDAT